MDIILANIINLIGVIVLIFWHTYISLHDVRKWFLLSIVWAFFLIIGSLMLSSMPVVLLNVLWIGVSLYWYFNYSKKEDDYIKNISNKSQFIAYIFLTIIVLILYSIYRNFDILAYYTTFLYVSCFYLFASHKISKEAYLFWCLIGFFLLVPHLFVKMQYSIFINETYWAIISFLWIMKNVKIKNYIWF